MQAYELLFIVRTDIEEEKITEVINWATNQIQTNGGTLEKVDRWNKRRLAYEINGHREGIYVLVNFQSNADCVKELERVLKISDNVVRHMVTKFVPTGKRETSKGKSKKEQPQKVQVEENAPAKSETPEQPEVTAVQAE